MVMQQFLYISQNSKTKTIDIDKNTNFDRFTIRDLKSLIIKNELLSINKERKGNELNEAKL